MKVSAKESREAQATVLAFRLAGRDLRKRINDATRAKFNVPWKSGISSRTRTKVEARVLVPGARVAAGNPPTFVAASSKRALSGGLVPDVDWPAVEFGTGDRNRKRKYQVTRGGTTFEVERHVSRQLRHRRKKGPVYLTLDEFPDRAASLWAQIVIKVYSDAAEGR